MQTARDDSHLLAASSEFRMQNVVGVRGSARDLVRLCVMEEEAADSLQRVSARLSRCSFVLVNTNN